MAKYWENRQIELEKLIQDKTDDTIIKVNKMYSDTFNELQQQIRKIFEKFTLDAGISASDAVKLLNREQTKDMRDMLFRMYRNTDDEKLKQELLNSLKAPAYAYRISRAEALRDLIYHEAKMSGYNVEKLLTDRLIKTYKESYYRTTYNTQVETGLHYNFDKLSNPAVKAAMAHEWKGSNYSKRIWKNTDKLAENLERIIKAGILSGQSQREMAAAIKKEMDCSTYMADRLIRTEVSYICGQGRLMSYKCAGIKKYIYIATLDLRTSEICRSLDHKVFSVEDAEVGKNFPPMHPNCRSVDGAYVERRDVSNLKRAARDPVTGKTITVPYDMTYQEWYDTYVKGDEDAKPTGKQYKDVLDEWLKDAKPNTHEIVKLKEYSVCGITYKVDNINVKQNNSKRELEVAELLKENFGGEIKLVPEINGKYSGVSTPDYIFKNQKWDLKELNGSGKDAVRDAIKKKYKQADNFIIDITKCKLTEKEVLKQAESVFSSDNTRFVDNLMIIRENEIIRVLKRI